MSEPIPPEQLRELINQERTARVRVCRDEVLAVLQKHRCRMEPSVILTPGNQRMDIQFIAEE